MSYAHSETGSLVCPANYWNEYEAIFHGRWPARYRALPEAAAEAALLEGFMLPCEWCVEVCEPHGRPTPLARYFHELRDHEDGMTLHGSVMDVYWECPHAEVLYGPYAVPCYVNEDGERYRTWADIQEESENAPDALLKAAAALEALKAAVELDKTAADYLIKHEKKKQVDEDYAESARMAEAAAKMEEKVVDAKRSGKSWTLGVELPCQYGLHNFQNEKGKWEKELVYTFLNPLTGKTAKHIYTECWYWEYVDPKTGKKVCKHVCNCFHPGQKGWKDEWLWSQESAPLYDRFKEWYCHYYDNELKQWMWDPKRTLRDADRVRTVKEKKVPETTGGAKREEAPKKKPASAGSAAAPRLMGGRFGNSAAASEDGWTTVAPTQDVRKVSTTTVWQRAGRK